MAEMQNEIETQSEIERLVRDGLQKGLVEAMANLYRVFTSPGEDKEREAAFLRGLEKHRTDYERIIEMIANPDLV